MLDLKGKTSPAGLLIPGMSVMNVQPYTTGSLVIIRSKARISDSWISKVKRDPNVKAVQRDYPVKVRDSKNASTSSNCPPEDLKIPLPDIRAVFDPLACSEQDRCQSLGRMKNWGTQRIDADLAEREVLSDSANSPVKIAVVDTGFDAGTINPLIRSGHVQVNKGWDGAGDPTMDKYGHGSFISTLIAGPQGVTKNVRLSTYRVTQAGEGNSSAAILNSSIIRACQDGNQVINLSWEWKPEPSVMETLSKNNCILVQAAGNSSDFDQVMRAGGFKESNLFLVQADSPSGIAPLFSSTGEFMAPGDQVFGYFPKEAVLPLIDKIASNLTCGAPQESSGADGHFGSGTSYASPIAAAVITQVLSVLNRSSSFQSMPGEDRTKLIHRILHASTTSNPDRWTVWQGEGVGASGNINALRAVWIAKRWMEQPSPKLAESKDLQALIAPTTFSFCAADLIQKEKGCTLSATDCASVRSCSEHQRTIQALCGDTAKSVELPILSSHAALFETESGLFLARKMIKEKANAIQTSEFATAVTKLSNQLVAQWSTTQVLKPNQPPTPEVNFISNLNFKIVTELLPFIATEAQSNSNAKKFLSDIIAVSLASQDADFELGVKKASDGYLSGLKAARSALGQAPFFSAFHKGLEKRLARTDALAVDQRFFDIPHYFSSAKLLRRLYEESSSTDKGMLEKEIQFFIEGVKKEFYEDKLAIFRQIFGNIYPR